MSRVRRFIIELIGSFFMMMAVVMSQSSTLHGVELAFLYGAMLYALNAHSEAGATFNLSVSIARNIAGKCNSGDFIVAILAQVIGVVFGAGLGIYLRENELDVIIHGNLENTAEMTATQFISGFLFSFLMCLVGSSASSELTISYPIAMMASIITGGMVSYHWKPFTAYNPLAEIMFYRPDTFFTILLKVISYLAGGILAGYYSLFMASCDRERDDFLIRWSDISENNEQSSNFDYKSWLAGVSVEGFGSFYITLVFALANQDTWAIAVGGVIVALTYLSMGGYFNPAITLAFYIQDRNCFHPTMSTLSMISYIISQLLFAIAAAWIALWMGHGDIRVPSVNPLVKSFPAVFLSEIIFTTLIIVCHMYSSRHSALAQQESLITVSHHEQQCLSVGFANTAALIAVSGLSQSILNPASAVALTCSVYLWELIYGFDQEKYGELNYNLSGLWVFLACPFIASVAVAVIFSVTIRMNSPVSRPTDGGQSHSPLFEESKIGNEFGQRSSYQKFQSFQNFKTLPGGKFSETRLDI